MTPCSFLGCKLKEATIASYATTCVPESFSGVLRYVELVLYDEDYTLSDRPAPPSSAPL